jgi:hypothetical protein
MRLSTRRRRTRAAAGFDNPYGGSEYRYVSTPMSWSAALAYCMNLDDASSTKRVHLVVLSSDVERSTHVYVNVVGSASEFWIGLSDTKVEGAYQWVTTEQVQYPDATSWAAGEPSTAIADDCVRVLASNTDLDSLPCTTLIPFVCECDGYAYDPTHYTLL